MTTLTILHIGANQLFQMSFKDTTLVIFKQISCNLTLSICLTQEYYNCLLIFHHNRGFSYVKMFKLAHRNTANIVFEYYICQFEVNNIS